MPDHANHVTGRGAGHRGSGEAWSRGLNRQARETATFVYNTITRNFRAFNDYCKEKRISDGENVVVDGVSQSKPFLKSELYAIAGTASNVLGCREQIGADLDFWSRANIRWKGRVALRIEFTPAKNPMSLGKDHVWMKKDHYTSGDPPSAVDPGASLPDHVNPGWTIDEDGHPQPPPPTVDPTGKDQDTWPSSMWIQSAIEFDVWSESANMWDHKVTYLIRQKVNKGGGLGVQFKSLAMQTYEQEVKDKVPGRKKPAKMYDYIYTLHCGDLILQKVSLILSRSRMLKGSPSFARGQQKFTNDAGDLGCLCHHEKCKDNIMASAVLRDICNRDWLRVSQLIANVPQPAYQAIAAPLYNGGDANVKVQTIDDMRIPAFIRRTFNGLDGLRLIPTPL